VVQAIVQRVVEILRIQRHRATASRAVDGAADVYGLAQIDVVFAVVQRKLNGKGFFRV
jgi:hypothetical protein